MRRIIAGKSACWHISWDSRCPSKPPTECGLGKSCGRNVALTTRAEALRADNFFRQSRGRSSPVDLVPPYNIGKSTGSDSAALRLSVVPQNHRVVDFHGAEAREVVVRRVFLTELFCKH